MLQAHSEALRVEHSAQTQFWSLVGGILHQRVLHLFWFGENHTVDRFLADLLFAGYRSDEIAFGLARLQTIDRSLNVFTL